MYRGTSRRYDDANPPGTVGSKEAGVAFAGTSEGMTCSLSTTLLPKTRSAAPCAAVAAHSHGAPKRTVDTPEARFTLAAAAPVRSIRAVVRVRPMRLLCPRHYTG